MIMFKKFISWIKKHFNNIGKILVKIMINNKNIKCIIN